MLLYFLKRKRKVNYCYNPSQGQNPVWGTFGSSYCHTESPHYGESSCIFCNLVKVKNMLH